VDVLGGFLVIFLRQVFCCRVVRLEEELVHQATLHCILGASSDLTSIDEPCDPRVECPAALPQECHQSGHTYAMALKVPISSPSKMLPNSRKRIATILGLDAGRYSCSIVCQLQ
jgi:hypothetical protein